MGHNRNGGSHIAPMLLELLQEVQQGFSLHPPTAPHPQPIAPSMQVPHSHRTLAPCTLTQPLVPIIH